MQIYTYINTSKYIKICDNDIQWFNDMLKTKGNYMTDMKFVPMISII